MTNSNHHRSAVSEPDELAQSMVETCPFATHYVIPYQQAWNSLAVFWIYRLILANLFVILFFLHIGPSLLGQYDERLYAFVSVLYLGLVCLAGLLIYLRQPSYATQALAQLIIDIAALTLIMHSSGGIASGIGVLIAVSIAAGGLLVGSRCALFIAALATLAIFSQQIHADLTQAFETTSYTYTGMLGASFYTIALLAHVLARRIEQSEAIAHQRAVEVKQLQQLNEYILEHLQSGMIIIERAEDILMMNASARQLFDLNLTPETVDVVSPQLYLLYQHWLSGGSSASRLKMADGSEVELHFSRFSKLDKPYQMIALERSSVVNQRVQQSKLASLGRLAASIAHEIRNPLSAISHAGQLLAESPEINGQDKRLSEIIIHHTQRLDEIVESVLQLSKRRPLVKEEILLSRWIIDFIQTFQLEHGLSESPFELTNVDETVMAAVDAGHLNQIMDNLCANALKHGVRDGEKIQLIIRRNSHSVVIEVIDNGPGIDSDVVRHLFEPFFTTSPSGTGLGLYIGQELAELNQAQLNYRPVEGGGSCFSLALPDAKEVVIEIGGAL